jgi:hypothetical protein
MSISTRPRARHALLLAPILLLLTTGYTDCQYFTKVTVPASDTGAPTTYDAVWKGGEYVEGAIPGQDLEYHITPGETVIALSSAIDSGGLKKLTMYSSFRYTCCNSSNICSVTQPLSVPKTETQPGGVGSTVSNGIWLYSGVSLPSCSSGFSLRSYTFGWSTEAEDFHGNITRGESQRIVYP